MPEDGLPQGVLLLEGEQLKVAAVGMGNPHVVVPVDDLASIPFDAWGAALEVHPAFPAKTNVHFLQVHSRERLEIRVWERGAGPTLACGTGACATLVAAVLLGLADDCAEVVLPGGPLMIEWRDRTGSVLMTGPAEAVFDGVLTPDLVPAGSSMASTSEALPLHLRRRPQPTSIAPRIALSSVSAPTAASAMRRSRRCRLSSAARPSTRCSISPVSP